MLLRGVVVRIIPKEQRAMTIRPSTTWKFVRNIGARPGQSALFFYFRNNRKSARSRTRHFFYLVVLLKKARFKLNWQNWIQYFESSKNLVKSLIKLFWVQSARVIDRKFCIFLQKIWQTNKTFQICSWVSVRVICKKRKDSNIFGHILSIFYKIQLEVFDQVFKCLILSKSNLAKNQSFQIVINQALVLSVM